jgi:hypothetical protein
MIHRLTTVYAGQNPSTELVELLYIISSLSFTCHDSFTPLVRLVPS